MKKLVLLTLTAIALTTVSCKNEKQEAKPEEPKAPVKENFYVEMDAKAAQKDDFAVYFTEDGTNDFNGQKAIWRGIKGVENQTVVFDVPVSVIPTNIRLDFGLNKAQDSVVVSRIKFAFLDKTHEIKGSQFFDFFIKDDQFKTEIDSAKGTMTIVKSGSEYKTPYFYPRQELIDKIKEMTQGNK